ncbi:cell wall-binding repeat-containing protein [Herbiconiux sp. VKM Ac-2851]|uniref:cell wall-binding repeat-containing protein n=1 Tax=Herbiconiux sp. VKM Ac-2851 TaxID=2739025 RepID=UPI0015657E55|nr:cell wall-binding repeat-containing protein [Herbiconiux sp. VKM Ac-2851]NQX36756.1 cell wall-binding repeat-containing protein [Herbiconiux sp. VKM Ac-2851]
MKPLFRALTFAVATALLSGGALSAQPAAAAVATSASDAAARSSARFDILDTIEPGSDELYGLAIDNVARKAFVLDNRNRMLRAYDVSAGELTPSGSVVVGTSAGWINGLAVNETAHQVYVVDNSSGSDELVVVDSASMKVVSRVATGGRGATALAVDEKSHRVFVANVSPSNVSVVDLDDGSNQSIATGVRPRDIAVDQATQTAYVANSDDSSLDAIKPDGSWTRTQLEGAPTLVRIIDGQLAVAGKAAFGFGIQMFDTATMTRTAVSESFASPMSDLVEDPGRNVVYVVNAAVDTAGIVALRGDNLLTLGVGPVDYFGDMVVDRASHRLIGLQNAASSKVLLIEPRVSPLPAVDRVGGADRFAVAAGVSRDTFESGAAPVAYVASGEVFADALSGAAAAGLAGGPVLLVTRDGVPAATAEELRRLRPGRIVVLGGRAAVGAGVEKALGEFGTVSRIGGPDRFAVSAAISAKAFPGGATYAYLASGETFPDALSASPLAGREKGPVLLTQKNALPAAVGAEIGRLKAQYVYVMGGEQAVSPAVVAEVEKQATVIRIDGPDRFAVSAAASKRSFRPHTYTVYVASGQAFPDALAGGPAAIIGGAPVLLVTKDGIPAPVAAELERLSPYRIVLLGGPNAVSDAVKTQLESYLPD